jgi:ubiquinone/menaquinone biosynthesis C-methylase UbiE
MTILRRLKNKLIGIVRPPKEIEPAVAYDIWATTYDDQPNNPIVYLDEIVFDRLLSKIHIEGKKVIDIGCGTGKHWEKILAKKPSELIGYDVSKEMLTKLHKKYPDAKTFLSYENKLEELPNNSCNIIISTLVIGYIENLEKAFVEWDRVLKTNGEILITDFHPDSVNKGAKRSFKHNERLVFIKNYLHSLSKIKELSKKMKWDLIGFDERKIDASIKSFFENTNSLEVYKRTMGLPILYAIHFKKSI